MRDVKRPTSFGGYLKINRVLPALLLFISSLFLPGKLAALNVIFILADDAGYGDFGAYGQKTIKTPNIDRMAKEGIRFTRHYAAAPVCAPSRSGLLTGTHTGHTPIRGNFELIPEGQKPLPDEAVTVAEILSDAGIKTAAFGKWGLGTSDSEGAPLNQGFDEWFGYLCQRQAHSYYPDYLWENDQRIELNGETWTHSLFTEKALEFIKENSGDEFFLYLPYTVPHAAMEIPEYGAYRDLDMPEAAKAYAAMISKLDSDIGRILAALGAEGIAEETLILVSSDNGPHAEGGADPDYFDSSGGLRGLKRDLYEGGIRVPLIGFWPGTIPPGTTTHHLSAFWDLMPTLAEAYGLESPVGDGISYLPTLLGGPQESQASHDYLYWEFHEQGGKQAVLQGDWKAVRRWVRLFPNRQPELYNLADDPAESRDVSDAFPEVARRMAGLMNQAHTPSREFPLLGRYPFSLQLFNTWLYMLPMLGINILFLAVARRIHRKAWLSAPQTFWGWADRGLTASLAALSLFLHLQFGTLFDPLGLGLTILGLVLYIPAQGYYLRRPGVSAAESGTPARWYRPVKECGSMVFWFGIGVAASSRLYLLAWLLTLTVRLIRYRAEKKRWHQGIREIPGIRERRSAGNQKSSIAT